MTVLQKMTEALEQINSKRSSSAWKRGVAQYTAEIMENVSGYGREPESVEDLNSMMLNGARNWSEYSWGGCSLIYDADIAEVLCTPSELKKTNNGERRPNSREEWLDVQARALGQAAWRIKEAYKKAVKA